jgi:hypothetical protein
MRSKTKGFGYWLGTQVRRFYQARRTTKIAIAAGVAGIVAIYQLRWHIDLALNRPAIVKTVSGLQAAADHEEAAAITTNFVGLDSQLTAMHRRSMEEVQKKAAAKAEAQRLLEAKAAKEAEHEKINVWVAWACRELVTKTLKDPDSAKWDRPWYSNVRISDAERMDIEVSVRAKNSFGAYGPTTVRCSFVKSGDKLITLQVDQIR